MKCIIFNRGWVRSINTLTLRGQQNQLLQFLNDCKFATKPKLEIMHGLFVFNQEDIASYSSQLCLSLYVFFYLLNYLRFNVWISIYSFYDLKYHIFTKIMSSQTFTVPQVCLVICLWVLIGYINITVGLQIIISRYLFAFAGTSK